MIDHGPELQLVARTRFVGAQRPGGGVVADSQLEAEYQETVNKARALLDAAEEAVRFASAARKGQ